MAADSSNDREQQTKIIFWFLAILVSINISIVSYTVVSLHRLDTRVTAIEANRWTAKDGANIYREISDINQKLARLPSEYPPQWIKDAVADNRNRLNILEEHLNHSRQSK